MLRFVKILVLIGLLLFLTVFIQLEHKLPNGYLLKYYYYGTNYTLISPNNKKMLKNIDKIGYCEYMVYGQTYKENDGIAYFLLNTETGKMEYPCLDFYNTKYHAYPMGNFADIDMNKNHDITKFGLYKCE